MDLPKSSPGRAGTDRLSPHRVLPSRFQEVIYMDVTAILQLIGSYGFPIVMCLLIWQDNRKHSDKMTELIQSNTQAMAELTNAIRNREV